MKTFINLGIGDTIWYLKTNSTMHSSKDYYGNVFGKEGVLFSSIIHAIELEGENLLINRKYNSYSGISYEFTIPKSSINDSQINIKDTIIFADQNLQREIVRKSVINYFKTLDNELEAKRVRNIEIKKEMRKIYWDALN